MKSFPQMTCIGSEEHAEKIIGRNRADKKILFLIVSSRPRLRASVQIFANPEDKLQNLADKVEWVKRESSAGG